MGHGKYFTEEHRVQDEVEGRKSSRSCGAVNGLVGENVLGNT